MKDSCFKYNSRAGVVMFCLRRVLDAVYSALCYRQPHDVEGPPYEEFSDVQVRLLEFREDKSCRPGITDLSLFLCVRQKTRNFTERSQSKVTSPQLSR